MAQPRCTRYRTRSSSPAVAGVATCCHPVATTRQSQSRNHRWYGVRPVLAEFQSVPATAAATDEEPAEDEDKMARASSRTCTRSAAASDV